MEDKKHRYDEGEMESPIVVFDTAIEQFQNNRIFNPEYAARFPGSSWLPVLHERCRDRGWVMMTSDMFLKTSINSNQVFCLSDMVTPFTELLLNRGVVASVIMSGESPNCAWDFYHYLTKYAVRYKHAFLFRGVQDRVKPPTEFHTLYWPNAQRHVLPDVVWCQRDFLVMVIGNRQHFSVSTDKPFSSLRRLAKKIIWRYLQTADPMFEFEDLYQKRIEAILHFAYNPSFKLFGTGWEQPKGIPKRHYAAIKKIGPMPVDDKLQTISNFKFALCFENCIFPGYVTEKIFDCFFAGCIPVYLGAPDITDFVPKETFIDFRQFSSFQEMEKYTKTLLEADARLYLNAAQDFINSSAFSKYQQETFISYLLSIFAEEFAASQRNR